jgi:hypothetical protein
MSWLRPSNASSRVIAPSGPMSSRVVSTSTMGRRRRAAAIASPSRVCAFSRTRSSSSWVWKVARSTTAGRFVASSVTNASPSSAAGRTVSVAAPGQLRGRPSALPSSCTGCVVCQPSEELAQGRYLAREARPQAPVEDAHRLKATARTIYRRHIENHIRAGNTTLP